MKALLVIFILVGFTACTKVCDLAESSASALAPKLAEKWGCTGVAQMQGDFKNVIAKSSACGSAKQGAVGLMVCPVLVDFARGQLANQIPASWGCSAALVGKDAAGALSAACSSVFPF